MTKTQNAKGQIYSLDFLIAAGLFVLAIGMLLNYFETSTYQAKEARTKNELSAVALTASNILLGNFAKCPLDNTPPGQGFRSQGYKVYGCGDIRSFASIKKKQLLIPDKFSCMVRLNGSLTTSATGGCIDDPNFRAVPSGSPAPATQSDIASVERKFLSPSGNLTKTNYEKCISNQGANPCGASYTENTVRIEVWPA